MKILCILAGFVLGVIGVVLAMLSGALTENEKSGVRNAGKEANFCIVISIVILLISAGFFYAAGAA